MYGKIVIGKYLPEMLRFVSSMTSLEGGEGDLMTSFNHLFEMKMILKIIIFQRVLIVPLNLLTAIIIILLLEY